MHFVVYKCPFICCNCLIPDGSWGAISQMRNAVVLELSRSFSPITWLRRLQEVERLQQGKTPSSKYVVWVSQSEYDSVLMLRLRILFGCRRIGVKFCICVFPWKMLVCNTWMSKGYCLTSVAAIWVKWLSEKGPMKSDEQLNLQPTLSAFAKHLLAIHAFMIGA